MRNVVTRAQRATAAMAFAVVACIATFAIAQQPAAPATRPFAIAVREWVILVSDPFQSQANTTSLFRDTLPDFIQTRRPRAAGALRNRPMPIGVIRIAAPPDTKLDVQIDVRNGQLLSTWPITRSRGSAVMWRDITVIGSPRSLASMDDQHWLAALRRAERPYLVTADRSERFLLYDVVLPFTAQLSLARGAVQDAMKIAHAGYTPLHELVLYRPEGNAGWQTAALASLDPPPGAAPPRVVPPSPAASSAVARQVQAQREAQIQQQIAQLQARQAALLQAQGQIPAADLQLMIAQYAAQQQQLEAQLPKPPAEPLINPAASAEKPGATELQLVRSSGADLAQLLAEWKARLAPYELDETDVNLILQILQTQIEESGRLTAVYRMDGAELARLLPLEVIPSNADVRRVALVIVKNIDPALPAEIDGLIVQLGDPDWKTREAASRSLLAIGHAARAKLQSALTHRDAEIAMRAERLLAAIANPSPGTAGPVDAIDAPAPVIRIIR